VFFWFLGTAVGAVWYVFRDPRFDYRFLLLGALLPDIVDVPSGQARWAHSLTFAIGVLTLVMVATFGRRPIRRSLLGLPIGILLHLVFDGMWTSTEVFWWPFTGSWGDVGVPSLERGWWNVVLEAIGLALVVWIVRTFGLVDAEQRRRFVGTGQLTAAPPPTTVVD
jgi:membrane-bound metal-dependent hydrolase YbcI (DUF457 family)